MEPERITMDDDDDDLVILEERPAPPKPPPDLTMDCVDEPLDAAQSAKRLEDYKAFKETMQLVKKWSIKPRLQTQRRNTIIMASKKPRPAGPMSLTRPPQPVQVSTGFRPLNVGHNFINSRPTISAGLSQQQNNRPPISVVRQKSLAPRGKILVRPSIRPTAPQSGGNAQGTTPTKAALPGNLAVVNGQVVNAQNMQPIFFDTNSGVLVVPGAGNATTMSPGTLPQLRGAVSISGVRPNSLRPTTPSALQRLPSGLQFRTPAPPPATPPTASTPGYDPFSPKIVSTSSLNTSANAKGTRPGAPVRYPPASQKTVTAAIVRPPRGASPAPVRAVSQSSPSYCSVVVPATTRPNTPVRSVPAILTRATPPPPLNPRPAPNSAVRPTALTPQSLNRPTTTPPVRPPLQYGGKRGSTARPAAPVPTAASRPTTPTQNTPISPAAPQMETTNTINGSQADKDTNNNKTFPSLVVLIKPFLGEKVSRQVLNSARAELDAKVKSLLVHTPAKLTEWLMQQGLLRLEHRCILHMTSDRENIKYKLGMYSDSAKQPFSGGYVWITECCPDTQISVFHGSIFESAVYTPGIIMKLIYHWACQTSAQNILQWVKVSSYYLKNFYTLLRSCCVAALHEFAPMMGGQDKSVEVGIITLGTPTSNTPNQRPIKIEIVGILDTAKKVVRMKVINPLGGSVSTSAQARLQQILWPLKSWVDKDSTILIDYSIDKSSLSEMGFKSVIQTKSPVGHSSSQPSNGNIMNYLKHVIPKMFQNTLTVLSKSLIQQFLDELSWRELWGPTSCQAFDNMINHLVQMTKWELDETLISRLNKISLNPFAEWSYTKALTPTGIDMLPDSIRGAGSGMPTLECYAAYVRNSNGYPNASSPPPGPPSPPSGSKKRKRKDENGSPNALPPILFPEISLTTPSSLNQNLKRKADGLTKEDLRAYLNTKINDRNAVNVFGYYYAETKNFDGEVLGAFPLNLKCPLCFKAFLTNQEIVRHIASHINSVGRTSAHVVYCEFCLKEMPNQTVYSTHLSTVHRQEHSTFPCFICLESYPNKNAFIIHMWQTHEKCEMPYKCNSCNFRSSRHHEVVEHFHREHGGSDQVQCPICLKIFSIRNAADIQNVVVHLQGHAGKKGKKCQQCILNFVTDMEVRSHTYSGMHETPRSMTNFTALRSAEDKVVLMPPPPKFAKANFTYPPAKKTKSNSVSSTSSSSPHHLPKDNKTKGKDKPLHLAHIDKGKICLETVRFYIHKDEDLEEVYNCCECKNNLLSDDHFPGCITCSKCPFSTSCEKSMFAHNKNNHQVGRPPKGVASLQTKVTKLPVRCECGERSENSKTLMSHMKCCGNKTGKLVTSGKGNDCDEDVANSKRGDEIGILSGLGLKPKT